MSETKGYARKLMPHNYTIVSFLSSRFRAFIQKISPFPKRMKPNIFNTLSVAPEVNAQRNKTSLLGTKSSGIAHFWMTHLNRREVVMVGEFWTN